MCKIQEKWSMAVTNLKASMNKNKNSIIFQQAIDILSRMTWTGRLQPFCRGKRRKQANRLYTDFWCHDSGTSENED
jgi:hypothetical protein